MKKKNRLFKKLMAMSLQEQIEILDKFQEAKEIMTEIKKITKEIKKKYPKFELNQEYVVCRNITYSLHLYQNGLIKIHKRLYVNPVYNFPIPNDLLGNELFSYFIGLININMNIATKSELNLLKIIWEVL